MLSWTDIEAKAKEIGVNPQDYYTAYNAKYAELRDSFNDEMSEIRAVRQQQVLSRNNNLDSACSVYQRADRILTGSADLVVQVTDDSSTTTPAWNDGKVVTFNSSAINEIDDATVTGLHGLNYHEMGHLLFTPRIGTDLGKWVVDNNYSRAFNMLEDSRAERLLIAKYPSIRPFLVALIGEYLINHPNVLGESFILLAGRKYYSISARRTSARLYANKTSIKHAKFIYSLVNEYNNLVFPRDYAWAKEIIAAFSKYVNSSNVDSPNGCSSRTVMRNGRPESGKEQERLQEIAASKESNDENLFDDSGNPTTGQSDDAQGNYPESDRRDWNDSNNADLLDALQHAVNNAKSDKTLRDKVRDTNKAIRSDSNTKPILTRSSSQEMVAAENREIMASRTFAQELERLRIDADPAWIRERPTGKLNVKRAMNADVNDINRLFDRWETGNDDYDIEACILIDRSGSMWQDIGSACRSAWVIKRAIERINGSVTVMTFNHNSKLLYSAEQGTTSNVAMVNAGGGTDPRYALLETERIMAQSRKNTKLVFILTDGQFYGADNDKTIARLNKSGCITNLVYLSNAPASDYSPEYIQQISHGVHNFRVIREPMDLVNVAKDVVRHHLKGAALRR